MNTLIVNLTRFGDLLQTQPVFSGLKKAGHSTGLVCLDNFAGTTDLLRDLDYVAVLRGGELLTKLDKDWRASVGALWGWCEESKAAFSPDHVVNLTASLSARLLSRKMTPQSAELRGFAVDDSGFGSNTDPWTTFLQASTRMRGCSPYNLVDLYSQAAGLRSERREYALREPDEALVAVMRAGILADAEEAVANSRLASKGVAAGKRLNGFVGFQLGASQDRRRWPLEQFVQLGDTLWRELGLVPVLLGAKGERGLADRYLAESGSVGDSDKTGAPVVDRVGKTSLTELAATLRCCELLVSNDTGTMHLAAGLGVPILAVFLATAQPWDTGAYLEGSCSLEPDMPCHPCPFGAPCTHENACRHKITHHTLFALIEQWRASGVWQAPDTGEARVWQAVRDDYGFMNLQALSDHDTADRTRWVRQQRHFYRQFLDRTASAYAPASADSSQNSGESSSQAAERNILPPAEVLPLSAEMKKNVLTELQQSAQLLHLLQEQGTVLRMQPIDMLKDRFITTWQRLQTLWDNSKYLNVLGFLWTCESQEAGGELDTALELAGWYHAFTIAWAAYLESLPET